MSLYFIMCIKGVPRWLSGEESAYQGRRCRRCEFDTWVRKIPWRRTWQPTPVFLPGKSHKQRSLQAHVVTKRWTRLSNIHSNIHTHMPQTLTVTHDIEVKEKLKRKKKKGLVKVYCKMFSLGAVIAE